MLKTARRMMISAALTVGLLVAALVPAVADDPSGGVIPCAANDICVGVTDPGSTPAPGQTQAGSSGGTDGGVPMCTWNGHQWPCWDDDLGWFDTSDGCYYHLAAVQPPAGDPAWHGNDPSTGAVYEVNCRLVNGDLTPKPPVFSLKPPGGPPPPDRPIDLARKALDTIHFDPPVLHAAPAGTAVVGVPVWLWYEGGSATASGKTSTVGPVSATANGRQISVTATVTLREVRWDTDDGVGVTCHGPGTEYRPGAVPDDRTCRYTYRSSSAQKKGTSFYLMATLIWDVTAVSSTGETLKFTPEKDVTTNVPLPLKVAEVQALN